MTKQEALDALYAVLVDGIAPDDISFTEEEHTKAVLAWNYFRKEGASERSRWVAAVGEIIKNYDNAYLEANPGRSLALEGSIVSLALQELLTRMEAS